MIDDRCPAITGNVRCELPARHNSPHQNSESGILTWEPAYVADLRRECEDGGRFWRAHLVAVLSDVDVLRSEAIDDAREALAVDEKYTDATDAVGGEQR